MKLREEQQAIIDDVMSSVAFGSDNIVLDLHTSFGKSLIMSELAKELDGRIVIMVNISPLIDQIAEHLDEIGLKYSILKAGYEDKFNSEERIQLVMSQTFYARKDAIQLYASYLIIDERHREFNTDRTNLLINHLKPKCIIGVTGTAIDRDGYALEGTETFVGSSIKHSESKGYIVPVRYYIPEWINKVDFDSASTSSTDFTDSSIDDIINNDEHTDLVIKSMNQLNAKEKKTLVFCNSIEHCENITKALKKDGYNAECTHSKQDSSFSDSVMKSFSSNSPFKLSDDGLFDVDDKIPAIKCLVSVSRLNTGFSVKDIELGVSLRPTKVRSLYLQTVGRLIRSFKGKEYCEFLDLANLVSMHGFHYESYNAPVLGDKKSLMLEKKKCAKPVVKLICKDEPTLITTDNIDVKLNEIKLAKEKIDEEQDVNKLKYLYNISDDISDIIRIAGIIGNRFFSMPIMSKKNIDFVSKEWEDMIDANPVHRDRIIKTLKTMAKNKITSSKKLVALKYSPEWLYTVNSEYVNHYTFEPDKEY